jgi:tetratricopeptide (TPR) repeat protein
VLLLLVTAAVHLPSLRGEFTNFDDDVYVTENPDVRRAQIASILDPRHYTASDWTPLVLLTHVVEHSGFGLNPLPYHATNWLLHIATTGLAYGLYRAVGVGLIPALLGGLLFGIHPLQVENVAWVASRKTLLAGLFGVGSVLLALRGRLGWAFVAFLAAALSKGTAVVVPLWIAAAFLLGFASRRPGRSELAWLALFGLVAALRAGLSAGAQAEVVERTAVAGLDGRLALMGPVLATQLRQLVLPLDLSPIYLWPGLSFWDVRVWLGWGVVGAVTGSVLFLARREAHVALFGAFAGIGLLPTLNLWPAPFIQADRYLHLSLFGAAILLVRAVQPLGHLRAWAPAACVLAWCAVLGVPISIDQTRIWRTSETLWQEVIGRNPEFDDAYTNLGQHYLREGDRARARPALERALELRPEHFAARFNLALLHVHEGRGDQAETELRALVEAHPDSAPAHGLLGRVLAHRDPDTALRHLDRALTLDPHLAAARVGRAHLHARAGRWEQAATDYRQLLADGESAPGVLNDLAAVRLAQGRAAEAAPLARQAVRAAPGMAIAWDTLATALLELKRLDEAAQALEQGLAADPDLADLHYRRARLLELRNDPGGAREAARRSLLKLGSEPRDWRTDAQRLAR